jgi:hypothetical protein
MFPPVDKSLGRALLQPAVLDDYQVPSKKCDRLCLTEKRYHISDPISAII